MSGEKDLGKLLKTMKPTLQEGDFVFCTIKDLSLMNPNDMLLLFKEQEGITIVAKKDLADRLKLDYTFVAAWITLTVHSSLEAVGLTAAFSTALAYEGISCNVVAAYYHDHLFVKRKDAERAMFILNQFSKSTSPKLTSGTFKPLPVVVNWQPNLTGEIVILRPLMASDFDGLYKVGSDPLIWKHHPEMLRYKREVFRKYFDSALESKGALLILDRLTGEILGCSRYHDHDLVNSQVFIGYTFLARKCWGKSYNKELKRLMINYAFRYVDTILFLIGINNMLSRKAIEKIGAAMERQDESLVYYKITKGTWLKTSYSATAS